MNQQSSSLTGSDSAVENTAIPSQSQTDGSNDKDGTYYYLNADAQQKLPNYQYRGADLSLLYHYVLSPLAAWCVDNLVPKTIAPNSITLFGLVWMITAYTTYWYYAPSLEIPILSSDEENDGSSSSSYPPRWIFLWNGISMLAYQTLDNMDGKQARRTKSSSPLGLLFDHGCDAINSIFGSANWIVGMALVPQDNLLECWALIFGPFAMFYIATWEEYHTGELIMPIVNGPNEGLLGGVLLSFTSWWYGPSFWQGVEWYQSLQSTVPWLSSEMTIRNCDFVVMAASIGFLQEILIKTISVTPKYSGSTANLLPFIVLSACFFLVGYLEPTVWLSLPRTSLHLAMLLFVEMSTELMLSHVTAQTFAPMARWHLIPLVGLTAWIGATETNDRESWVQYYIIAYAWSLAAYLIFKIVLVIREICSTLQIWCFDIVSPYPKAAPQTKIESTSGQSGPVGVPNKKE
jgi:ethanolaminephosphotransferase